MGDLHRHAEIVRLVHTALARIRPDEDYALLALGNYLTAVVEGLTYAVFADDVPQASFWRSAVVPHLGGLAPLPAVEVERVLGAHWTQYFPHEHVDRPPVDPDGEPRGAHPLHRRGHRRLSAYLEEDIDVLSESLTGIEVDWKAAVGLDRSEPRRHDVLVRLGTVLHAVEDFFFHSNHAELHLWHGLRRERPRGETDEAYRVWFMENVRSRWLPPDGGDATQDGDRDVWRPSPTQQVRTHLRRLHHPGPEPEGAPDRSTSGSSLDHLHTGGFGSADLFHTVGAALEGLGSAVDRSPLGRRGTEPVLLRALVDRAFRSRMAGDRRYLDEQVRRHREQLGSGLFERGIDHLRAQGYLNERAAAAWRRAVAVDAALERVGPHTPGVGGFLLGTLARAHEELERSRTHSRRLDSGDTFGPGNVFDVRPDNGASGEHLGSHTLMAKDSATSLPLHREAKRLARFASVAVATTLASEVSRSRDTTEGLDWDVVLRHYLRFPSGDPSGWESQVLEHVRTHAADPTVEQVTDLPPTLLASGAQGAARLARRRAGSLRAELERRYVALEERADGTGPGS